MSETYDFVEIARVVADARKQPGFPNTEQILTAYCNERARDGWKLHLLGNVAQGGTNPMLVFVK